MVAVLNLCNQVEFDADCYSVPADRSYRNLILEAYPCRVDVKQMDQVPASHADNVQVRSPADAANLFTGEMSLLEQEPLRTILLDTKNHVMGIPTIYIGAVNMTMIRVSKLIREAVRRNCPANIVLHNQPSGDAIPSPEDMMGTRQAVETGKLLDIELLDPLAIGRNRLVR